MCMDKKWHDWALLIQEERPWKLNNVTTELLSKVQDTDMASVIWAFMGDSSLEWIDKPLPPLNNLSVITVLQEKNGKNDVWKVLEAMSTWM